MLISFIKKQALLGLFSIVFSFIVFIIFKDIFASDEIIIDFAIHPFNICDKYPDVWKSLKISYVISCICSNLIIINSIVSFLFSQKNINNHKYNISSPISTLNNEIQLLIGKNSDEDLVFLNENGLYQNILITRDNWFWKNKFCYVSIYRAINCL